MAALIEKMAQTQMESTKLLCESLQSTPQEETELKLIKADLEKMKDQFEKIMKFEQHLILMDAKFDLMTGIFNMVGERLEKLIEKVDNKADM